MSFRIAGIGELLWDVLPAGRKLGGAPANFIYHAHALGADGQLISRVGADLDGCEALEELRQLGLSTNCIGIDSTLRTGIVSVQIENGGQPHYTIHENVAWDALQADPQAQAAVASADAICFGTLAQRSKRSRETIHSLLALAPRSVLRILDVNLRPPYVFKNAILDSLHLANALKLNETELPQIADFLGFSAKPREFIRAVVERFGLRCVAITHGADGSSLFSDGEWSDQPSSPTQVVDTIGAGDSFTAAMALGILAKWPLKKVHMHASKLAAFVCSQAGATPALPAELKAPFLTIRRNCP